MSNPESPMLLLGGGYVLTQLATTLPTGSFIITTRNESKLERFKGLGWRCVNLDFTPQCKASDSNSNHSVEVGSMTLLENELRPPASISVIIDSIPPLPTSSELSEQKRIQQVIELGVRYGAKALIYLSSTGVYGVSDGSVVTEESACNPISDSGRNRLMAESYYRSAPLPTYTLRLSGIYGPNRDPIERIRSGQARMVLGAPRYSNRVHVDDIVEVLRILVAKASQGRSCEDGSPIHQTYNLTDDAPTPLNDVIKFYCHRFNLPLPQPVEREDLQADSRLLQNARVSNAKLKQQLGYQLKFPNYQSYLTDLEEN